MPLPTSYTEERLKQFMIDDLSNIGRILGWSVASREIEEAVYDALFAYGVDTVPEAIDPKLIRWFAQRAAWRRAVKALASFYEISADEQRYERDTLYKQAKEILETIEASRPAATGALASAGGGVVELIDADFDYDDSLLNLVANSALVGDNVTDG